MKVKTFINEHLTSGNNKIFFHSRKRKRANPMENFTRETV